MYLQISWKEFGLVMVGIDIDDAELLVAALGRLVGRVLEDGRGVDLADAHVAVRHIAQTGVHRSSPCRRVGPLPADAAAIIPDPPALGNRADKLG